jgi:hypothetical protein
MMSRSPKTLVSPSTLAGFVRVAIFLRIDPGLSKVIEAWSTHPRQPMSSASKKHVDDLPSTSQDTIVKKKSRVKFPCLLCQGSHLTHLCPHMEEASKFLEDIPVSQPQLPAAYRKLTLDPPIVDGMINPVPPSVSLVDQVVDLIPSSVDPTLPLESVNKVVDRSHLRSLPLSL